MEYNSKHEKFLIEIENFCKQNKEHTLGEVLKSITTQISKTGKSFMEIDDETVLSCIEKAILYERD